MNLPVPAGMDPKRFKILLGIICVCGLLTLKGVAESFLVKSDEPLPSPPPKKTAISDSAPPARPIAIAKAEMQKQDNLRQTAVLSAKNPFIDPASLPKKPQGGNRSALPTIPQTTPAPVGNIPIPAIPSQPVRPVGGSAAKASMGVQGVLTGGQNGNMAIMSDGTVVSEGDTYHDQRIAYIGGDGITFDNGHHLDYK